jgi:hypothetical protein
MEGKTKVKSHRYSLAVVDEDRVTVHQTDGIIATTLLEALRALETRVEIRNALNRPGSAGESVTIVVAHDDPRTPPGDDERSAFMDALRDMALGEESHYTDPDTVAEAKSELRKKQEGAR